LSTLLILHPCLFSVFFLPLSILYLLIPNCFSNLLVSGCTSVQQTAKLIAALLSVARVTAGLAESNGSLPPGL